LTKQWGVSLINIELVTNNEQGIDQDDLVDDSQAGDLHPPGCPPHCPHHSRADRVKIGAVKMDPQTVINQIILVDALFVVCYQFYVNQRNTPLLRQKMKS
jgi:hypothetical protein